METNRQLATREEICRYFRELGDKYYMKKSPCYVCGTNSFDSICDDCEKDILTDSRTSDKV